MLMMCHTDTHLTVLSHVNGESPFGSTAVGVLLEPSMIDDCTYGCKIGGIGIDKGRTKCSEERLLQGHCVYRKQGHSCGRWVVRPPLAAESKGQQSGQKKLML
jgi:hypothetical protein